MGRACLDCGVWVESFDSAYKRGLGRCDDCRKAYQRLRNKRLRIRERLKLELLRSLSADDVLEYVGYYDDREKVNRDD